MNISIYELIWPEVWPIRVVLMVLFLFSITSWGIVFVKYIQYWQLRRSANRFMDHFGQHLGQWNVFYHALRQTPHESSVLARLFCAAMTFFLNSDEAQVDRSKCIERILDNAAMQELQKVEYGLSWIASIASISPYLGLLGTVMGIVEVMLHVAHISIETMSSWIPGLGQALVTTAVGLLVAIPAVFFYNTLSACCISWSMRLYDFQVQLLNGLAIGDNHD